MIASDTLASAVLPVFVVDLETLACIEASASNLGRDGCCILSEQVCELREQIGLRIAGLDKMLRGKITSLTCDQATVSFVHKDTASTEKRHEKRRKVSIPVQIYDHARTFSMNCRIIDASKSGCRLEGAGVQALPEDILLRIRGLSFPVNGKIVWLNGDRAGVRLLWEFSSSRDINDFQGSALSASQMVEEEAKH